MRLRLGSSLIPLLLLLLIPGLLPANRAAAQSPTARVQFIHNAADPTLATIDVYIDSNLYLDDFSFRTATDFRDVPADTTFMLGFAPSNSSSGADLYPDPNIPYSVRLDSGMTYTIMVTGVLTPPIFAPNPDGQPTIVQPIVNATALESARPNPSRFFFNFMHGATDVPAVDAVVGVDVRSRVDTLAYGLRFRGFSGYKGFLPGPYSTLLTARATGEVIAAFFNDFSLRTGEAATLVASGFLNPGLNRGGAPLALLMVSPNGDVTELLVNTASETENALPESFRVLGNYPNPFNPATVVRFDTAQPARVGAEVFDPAGRRVLSIPSQPFPAGSAHTLRVDASSLPAGLYIYHLTAETPSGLLTDSGRMVLLK